MAPRKLHTSHNSFNVQHFFYQRLQTFLLVFEQTAHLQTVFIFSQHLL